MSYVRTYLCIYVHSVNTRNAPNTINEYKHTRNTCISNKHTWYTYESGMHEEKCVKPISPSQLLPSVDSWNPDRQWHLPPLLQKCSHPPLLMVQLSVQQSVKYTVRVRTWELYQQYVQQLTFNHNSPNSLSIRQFQCHSSCIMVEGWTMEKLCIHKPYSAGQ